MISKANDSKNILQFMCYRAPYGGNFIKSIVRLEKTAKKEGVETIYVFHTDISEREWIKDLLNQGKKIYFLGEGFLKDTATLKKIVIEHDIRYLHVHFTGAKYHVMFNLVRLQYNKKLFTIRHLHNHDTPKNSIIQGMEHLLSQIDLYIGCSQSVAMNFQKAFKVKSGKMTFADNAIDFSRLDKFEKLKRDDYNIGPETTIFLIFGFDYHRKGVDIAFEAVDGLIKQQQDVCLMVSLSRNREMVEANIKERFGTIPEWLKILNPIEDIGTYYRFTDCFLSASREEGFSYSLVEAAYSEVPIVSSDIPGPSEHNIPYTYLFPSEDVKKLQEKMMEVISLTPEQRNQITLDQKAFVIKYFDLQVWADKVFSIYKQLSYREEVINFTEELA